MNQPSLSLKLFVLTAAAAGLRQSVWPCISLCEVLSRQPFV